MLRNTVGFEENQQCTRNTHFYVKMQTKSIETFDIWFISQHSILQTAWYSYRENDFYMPRYDWRWYWISRQVYSSNQLTHYTDVTMSPMASRITSLGIVYSTVYSVADQRKHQSSASLAFVRRIHRGPVNSPHKWPVTRKMFPFDDVIMTCANLYCFTKSYNVFIQLSVLTNFFKIRSYPISNIVE